MVGVHNQHRIGDDHEDKVEASRRKIRSIAQIVGFNTKTAVRCALFESIIGEHYGIKHSEPPKSRVHRWDAIHLATAEAIQANRVYGWDAKWSSFPLKDFPSIGQIICPALCPQADLLPDD